MCVLAVGHSEEVGEDNGDDGGTVSGSKHGGPCR